MANNSRIPPDENQPFGGSFIPLFVNETFLRTPIVGNPDSPVSQSGETQIQEPGSTTVLPTLPSISRPGFPTIVQDVGECQIKIALDGGAVCVDDYLPGRLRITNLSTLAVEGTYEFNVFDRSFQVMLGRLGQLVAGSSGKVRIPGRSSVAVPFALKGLRASRVRFVPPAGGFIDPGTLRAVFKTTGFSCASDPHDITVYKLAWALPNKIVKPDPKKPVPDEIVLKFEPPLADVRSKIKVTRLNDITSHPTTENFGFGRILVKYTVKPGIRYELGKLEATLPGAKCAEQFQVDVRVIYPCEQPRAYWQRLAEVEIGDPGTTTVDFATPPGKPKIAKTTFQNPENTNVRITRAYAKMWLADPTVFTWAGVAAFGSDLIGRGMVNARNIDEAPTEFIPPLLTVRHIGYPAFKNHVWNMRAALYAGNYAIFSDLYWQHLAFFYCGLEEMKHLLDRGELSQRAYDAWEDIASGDRKRIAKGNKSLFEIEQLQVVQASTYDPVMTTWHLVSTEAKGMGFPEITSPIPRVASKTFGELYPGSNFGDSKARWGYLGGYFNEQWESALGDSAMKAEMEKGARDLLQRTTRDRLEGLEKQGIIREEIPR